jgi:hypothetical protein
MLRNRQVFSSTRGGSKPKWDEETIQGIFGLP